MADRGHPHPRYRGRPGARRELCATPSRADYCCKRVVAFWRAIPLWQSTGIPAGRLRRVPIKVASSKCRGDQRRPAAVTGLARRFAELYVAPLSRPQRHLTGVAAAKDKDTSGSLLLGGFRSRPSIKSNWNELDRSRASQEMGVRPHIGLRVRLTTWRGKVTQS